MSQSKIYLWIAIIVVVLAVAGFGVYFFILKPAPPAENLLSVNNSAHKNSSSTQELVPVSLPLENFSTPQNWRDKYFPNCNSQKLCGDDADPDRDGLTNLEENKLGADPNNRDSDQDGLADGDEVHVFGFDALNSHTSGDPKYSDVDYIVGGYDLASGKLMIADQLAAVSAKIQKYDLHQPTLSSLGDVLGTLYKFNSSSQASSTSSTSLNPAASSTDTALDQSLSAKQDRDTRRSNTIKNIEIGLVKYQADNNTYPPGDFNSMFTNVRPYLKVATNPQDPINKEPYIYSYSIVDDGADFSLSFYSEVAGEIIKKNADDAQKQTKDAEAEIYDSQRQMDLESLRVALLVYSQKNIAGSQEYVFPSKAKYKTTLVPEYITAIPKDPVTREDYDYQVSATFDAFSLKTALDNPPEGNTGYMCNQVEECHFY